MSRIRAAREEAAPAAPDRGEGAGGSWRRRVGRAAGTAGWRGGAVVAFLILVAGCQGAATVSASPKEAAPRTGAAGEAGASSEAGEAGEAASPAASPIEMPPGLKSADLAPLEGEALARAKRPLERVLAELREEIPEPEPDLEFDPDPEAEAGEGEDGEEGEVPLSVQKAYARARAAWRGGQHYEAIRRLKQGLARAPRSPALLRLMAWIHSSSGNLARGAVYLERWVAVQPEAAEALYLLGRFAQEQGRWEEATRWLLEARRLAEEAWLRPLIDYRLGVALVRRGYAAAGGELLRGVVEAEPTRALPKRFYREMGAVIRQRAMIERMIGDAHLRVGRVGAARRAYERAMAASEAPGAALRARLVLAALLDGARAEARDRVLEALAEAPEEKDLLELARYAADRFGQAPAWRRGLETIYREAGEPGMLALLRARGLAPRAARKVLADHLARHPQSEQVLDRWVATFDQASSESLARLVAEAAALIEATGDGGPSLARRLVEGVETPARLVEASREVEGPGARLLRGLALLRADRTQEGVAALEQVVETAPEWVEVRTALARVLILTGELARAGELLEGLPETHRNRSGVQRLRLQWLNRSGRHEEALALLERMMEADPSDVALARLRARILWRPLGRVEEAERALLNLLNRHPEHEPAYAMLFRLYDSPDAPRDAVEQYQRLMRRMLREIPRSRIARLKRAELLMLTREGRPEARKLLNDLLEAEPRDYEALGMLLQLMRRAGERKKGETLLENRLEKRPEDLELLQLAREYYEMTGQQERQFEVTRRLIDLQMAPGERKTQTMAVLLLNFGRPGEAVDLLIDALSGEVEDPRPLVQVLARAVVEADRREVFEPRVRKLIEAGGEAEPDLRYFLASFRANLGHVEEAQAMFEAILERFPDHAPTANALGYGWADRGKRLEEAKALIRKALESEPDNWAYLDSLGWVYYKLGDFEEALKWLKRSAAAGGEDHPVILDHLGDTYYRLGNREEARAHWERARRHYDPADAQHDHELRGMNRRVLFKIEAIKDEKASPVADIAEVPEASEE